jgi:hypothetical protein
VTERGKMAVTFQMAAEVHQQKVSTLEAELAKLIIKIVRKSFKN